MRWFLESVIAFIITFLLQIIGIVILEKKKSKKINKSNVEDEYKRNNKLIIKILVALLISILVSIIVFYGIGIAILIGLQEGR